MQTNDDILGLLKDREAEAQRQTWRGVILQPGGIGDCILTLPLVEFMKQSLDLLRVDLIGHTEYVGIFPGRTAVDSVHSIDSIELHRLFVEAKDFELADRDVLINTFAGYCWIVTFLGGPNTDFEKNLIFTANCSNSNEVISLPLKPPADFSSHLTDFYIQQFIDQCGLSLKPPQSRPGDVLIKAAGADRNVGRELLEQAGLGRTGNPVIIQPGSGGLHKCWHLDNFLAIAEKLTSEDFKVIFLLGPAEQQRFAEAGLNDINMVAECLTDLSLSQVVGLLSCADAFVGNDGGITHLAAGLGLKTLVVFGPTQPAVYRPVGPAVTVFADNSADFAHRPSQTLQQEVMKVLLGCLKA